MSDTRETLEKDTSGRTVLFCAGALAVLGVVCLAIDLPAARWCRDGHIPGDLKKVFTLAEVFGHGIGVGMIILAAWVLDPARRWAIPRVAALAFGAGLMADVAKLLVARVRPRAFDLTGNVTDTFVGLFPFGSGGSNQQSFPSAHVATAVGLAIALAWLYPRGRWLFGVLAVLVAGQRLMVSAHYPSDTCFGAAVACLLAVALLGPGPLSRWFARHEARWRLRAASSDA
ncbi:MAG: phosphatase PAP2 family protein [Pirellulales bacterium]|nr:phosphatase PAP2 family protein [Pirellulales bacterium]